MRGGWRNVKTHPETNQVARRGKGSELQVQILPRPASPTKTKGPTLNYNKCLLGGNLTRDPELRYTPKGAAVCGFGIAINRSWKTEAGEKKEEVSFLDVECFGRTAENIAKFFKKGRPIFLECRAKLDQWEDKTSGKKMTKVKFVVESFQFCGGDKASQPDSQPSESRTPVDANTEPVDAGDVPF